MNSKTILLVEDNRDDELLTLRALKKNNLANDVVVVRDGAAAFDYLAAAEDDDSREHAHRMPHVVLLDLKLPKIDGLGLLDRLRANERTRLLPIVVLTSSREHRDLIESYRRGANSYVRKPVDFNQFVEAVRQLGLYWLVLNEAAPPLS